jgi:hypothetical protein
MVYSLQFSGEGLVEQRLFQLVQRGVNLFGAGFGFVHVFPLGSPIS